MVSSRRPAGARYSSDLITVVLDALIPMVLEAVNDPDTRRLLSRRVEIHNRLRPHVCKRTAVGGQTHGVYKMLTTDCMIFCCVICSRPLLNFAVPAPVQP